MRTFYGNKSRTLSYFTGIQLEILYINIQSSVNGPNTLLYIKFPVESLIKIQNKFLIF